MKIRMLCLQCPTQYLDEMFLVEEQDESLYQLSCTRGHEINVGLQNHKFELLFDSGSLALLDGYPRESVSSITAALERFMEFYTKIVVLKRLANQGSHKEISQDFPLSFLNPLEEGKPLDETWKRVTKQSERQMGAFCFVYLLENGTSPPPIDELKMESYRNKENKKLENKSFRNAVIHNGYAASTKQVLEYGEQIFGFIRTILTDLRKNCTPEITKYTMGLQYKSLLENKSRKTLDEQRAVQVIPTVISTVTSPEEGPKSFEAGLAWLKELRTRAYS